MILELAELHIRPNTQTEFDQAITHGVQHIISQAQGFLGYQVHKGIESPERYLLTIQWEALEDHTVGFRESPAFQEWRALVGPFFTQPPMVEHFTLVTQSS